MPLYFFHIENGHRITSDEGEEFPDDKSALQEADAIAADLSRNQISPTGLRVIVTSRTGDQVGEVPLVS
jgi:hypothetical protein